MEDAIPSIFHLVPSHRTAYRMAPHEQAREVRAGSTAKATATAEDRGHIRGLGRPGVSSSHPAVLKSPVDPGPSQHLHVQHQTDHICLAPILPRAGQRAGQVPDMRSASGSFHAQHFLTARTTSTIYLVGFWCGLHRAPDQSLVPSSDLASGPYRTVVLLSLLPDVASRPPAGPAKSRAGQGCPSPR